MAINDMTVWCRRAHRVGREERCPELRARTPTRRGLPGIGLRSAPSESIPVTVSSAGKKKYAVRNKVARFSDILPQVHRSHVADHGYPGAAKFARVQPRDHRLIPFWSHRWALLQQMATASPAALPAAACTRTLSISLLTAPLCALPSQIALPRCTIEIARSTIAHGAQPKGNAWESQAISSPFAYHAENLPDVGPESSAASRRCHY